MKTTDVAKVVRGLIQVPLVGSTIAFCYNYGCNFKFSQEEAVGVALGRMYDYKRSWFHSYKTNLDP